MRILAIAFLLIFGLSAAEAANCKRNGSAVTCDDGRTGIFTGDENDALVRKIAEHRAEPCCRQLRGKVAVMRDPPIGESSPLVSQCREPAVAHGKISCLNDRPL